MDCFCIHSNFPTFGRAYYDIRVTVKPSIKTFVTDLLIGGAYSLGDKWYLPTIQAGITGTMFNGLKTGEYPFTFENPEL